MSSRTTGGITATLSSNGLDQMTQWNAGPTNQEFYAYDATGGRTLKRTINGSTTSLTVYAFGLEEHVYSGSGVLQSSTYYYSLGGRLLGTTAGNSQTQFVLTDALGSVLTTFSNAPSGAGVQGTQEYGPYGTRQNPQGTMGTTKGFTGQYTDSQTGLDYYHARYYDPAAGVFLSADTVQGNPAGMNPYAYVEGNPETWSDPTGQRPVPIGDGSDPGGDMGGGAGGSFGGGSTSTQIAPPVSPGAKVWSNPESTPSSPSDPVVDPPSPAIIPLIGGCIDIIAICGPLLVAAAAIAFFGDTKTIGPDPAAPWQILSFGQVNGDQPDVPPATGIRIQAHDNQPATQSGGAGGGQGIRPPNKVTSPPPPGGGGNPKKVRYTQNTCSPTTGGRTVLQNAVDLQEGNLTVGNGPGQLPPIKIFQKQPFMDEWGPMTKYGHTGDPANLANGEWYSLNNRRLAALHISDLDYVA